MSNFRIKGFTLIELMIVVAIMSVLLMLIGPNLFNTYQKAQYSTDEIKLKESLKKLSYKSFVNGREMLIRLDKGTLYYQYNDEYDREKKIEFDHIEFSQQGFYFTKHGFSTVAEVKLLAGSQRKAISLEELNPL